MTRGAANLLIATAAASLFVLSSTPNLDRQGLHYDEVHPSPAAFVVFGKPAYQFVAVAWKRLPLCSGGEGIA